MTLGRPGATHAAASCAFHRTNEQLTRRRRPLSWSRDGFMQLDLTDPIAAHEEFQRTFPDYGRRRHQKAG